MIQQDLHPTTEAINKAQKRLSKKARTDALLWLVVTFPAAFNNTLRIRPLKVGIMNDILLPENVERAMREAGVSKSKLREAVVLFTRRLDYLTCLKLREKRVDLDGNLCTEVTEQEANHAAVKIKRRIDKSTRNARKTVSDRPPSSAGHYQPPAHSNEAIVSSKSGNLPIYPPRGSAHLSQSAPVQSTKVTSVTVTHKTTRQFDPSVVARLKAKLGLPNTMDQTKETTETESD